VSAGGEEFTFKLEKLLAPPKRDKNALPLPRPKFLHGKMIEVVKKIDDKKPFLLYLSGDDRVSREFELKVLTQPDIIKMMVSLVETLMIVVM
jgi:hypothetical protein